MPGIGGRLGWNEPPPAAMTTILLSNTLALIGLHPKQRIADLLDRLHHFIQMILGIEGLDLLQQSVDQTLRAGIGDAGNVVDRLLGIKLGALSADLVENVDELTLHVEQAKLEHGKKADRSGADNDNVSLDRLTHSDPYSS